MKKDSLIVKVENDELKITNPNKLLFPKVHITKWDFIKYQLTLAPYLLRYAKDRLLTVIRFPHGVDGSSFYQKNSPPKAPSFVVTKIEGNTRYILLNNLPTIIWLANLSCLEFHSSFHTAFSHKPTELVFDIDPSVPNFSQVMEVALYTREAIQQLGLDGCVKTSGATGLQIYVPIQAKYTFEQTRKMSYFIAKYLKEKYPQLITIERIVKKRGTKVYFDYLQHWYHKTLIAPYSTRATEQATVSTPLDWSELKEGLEPGNFTLHTISSRLQDDDPFAPIYSAERYSIDEILSFLER